MFSYIFGKANTPTEEVPTDVGNTVENEAPDTLSTFAKQRIDERNAEVELLYKSPLSHKTTIEDFVDRYNYYELKNVTRSLLYDQLLKHIIVFQTLLQQYVYTYNKNRNITLHAGDFKTADMMTSRLRSRDTSIPGENNVECSAELMTDYLFSIFKSICTNYTEHVGRYLTEEEYDGILYYIDILLKSIMDNVVLDEDTNLGQLFNKGFEDSDSKMDFKSKRDMLQDEIPFVVIE